MQPSIVVLFVLLAVATAAPANAPKDDEQCRFCIDILHLARDKIEEAEGKYFNRARYECTHLPNALLARACLTMVNEYSKEMTDTIDSAYDDVSYCSEILGTKCEHP